jgi:hypothetical protein
MDAGERHEARKAGLPTRLASYWEEAEWEEMQPDYVQPTVERDEWGILSVAPGLVCPGYKEHKIRAYGRVYCKRPAGTSTDHEGIGMCSLHGGNFGRHKTIGAILTAMAYADELHTTPWEALLQQVRMLANQVQWLSVRVRLAEETDGADALKPGGSGWDWVCLLEARGDRLAKVSKMAIDAGVATQLVQQVNLEAEGMYKAALAAFMVLGIEGDQKELALEAMATELERLEKEHML